MNTTENRYKMPNHSSIEFVFSDLKDDLAQKLTVLQSGSKTICNRKDKVKFSSLNLEEYTGTYYSDELEISYSIFLEDGKLKVKFADYNSFELKPYKQDTFLAKFGLLRFYHSSSIIKGFELDAGRVLNLKFEKKLQ